MTKMRQFPVSTLHLGFEPSRATGGEQTHGVGSNLHRTRRRAAKAPGTAVNVALSGRLCIALALVLAACGSGTSQPGKMPTPRPSPAAPTRRSCRTLGRRCDHTIDQARRRRSSTSTTIKQYPDPTRIPAAAERDLQRSSRHQRQRRHRGPQDRPGLQVVPPAREHREHSFRCAPRSHDDDNVFAVIGTFYRPSGDAQTLHRQAGAARAADVRPQPSDHGQVAARAHRHCRNIPERR